MPALREQLTIQENVPDPVAVTSITRTSTTATVTTTEAHGFSSNDYVTIAGATETGYNGRFKIVVTAATTFTYVVANTVTTPATGTITATYFSDASGGRRIGWAPLVTVWAELVPLRAMERLQLQALQAQVDYRFRIRARADLTPQMRAVWTPQWPPGSPAHTLEIHGVIPDGDGRHFQLLDCGEIAA